MEGEGGMEGEAVRRRRERKREQREVIRGRRGN